MKKILAVTSTEKLGRKYGSGIKKQILEIIAQKQSEAEKSGTILILVDTVLEKPAEIKKYFDGIERIGGSCEAYIIIGGDDIIPFFRYKNFCEDDDRHILTDNPYSSNILSLNYEDHLIPDRPLARIPDTDLTASGKTFLEILSRSLDFFPAAPAASLSGYSAAVWKKATAGVLGSINRKYEYFLSPPVTSVKLKEAFFGSEILFFNLHGSDESPFWYGQSGTEYPVALKPENLLGRNLQKRIVFSEACYGADIERRKKNESLAVLFLASGGAVFCGSTMIAYGPDRPPATEADLMGLLYFKYLKAGRSSSEAFLSAKKEFAKVMLDRQGFLDDDDKKTLLEFVHYGNPFARLG